jgi:hypothetical protein
MELVNYFDTDKYDYVFINKITYSYCSLTKFIKSSIAVFDILHHLMRV